MCADNIRSEDTIIFNGLTPKISKMSNFYDALNKFTSIKQSIDSSDRFNVILYEGNGPVYLDDFTLYPETLLKLIKPLEKKMDRANIAGGIFIACTFIIDVFKKISDKCYRLIILTDAGSLKIPKNYVPILNNLIDQVKNMPLFIDIVRINIKDASEDLKLMKLADKAKGKFLEIKKLKELPSVMEKLAQKKDIKIFSTLSERLIDFTDDNKLFFENLAEDPSKVSEGRCSICFKNTTDGLVKCPKCETIAHERCWSHWAKKSNIGLFNVFRCHNCFNLIRLSEEIVFAAQRGEIPFEKKIKTGREKLVDYLKNLEKGRAPEIVQVEDPMAIPIEEQEQIEFPTEIEQLVKGAKNKKEKEIMDKIKREKSKNLRKELSAFLWCPNCNQIIKIKEKICPNCFHPL